MKGRVRELTIVDVEKFIGSIIDKLIEYDNLDDLLKFDEDGIKNIFIILKRVREIGILEEVYDFLNSIIIDEDIEDVREVDLDVLIDILGEVKKLKSIKYFLQLRAWLASNIERIKNL